MAKKHLVLYHGLRSTSEEYKQLSIREPSEAFGLKAFQRGLIVVKDLTNGNVKKAYSVAATGYNNRYDLFFQIEQKEWPNDKIRSHLRSEKGSCLETIVALDKAGDVPISEFGSGMHLNDPPHYQKFKNVPLHVFLYLEDGVFPKLQYCGNRISPSSFPDQFEGLVKRELKLKDKNTIEENIDHLPNGAVMWRVRLNGKTLQEDNFGKFHVHRYGRALDYLLDIKYAPLRGYTGMSASNFTELLAAYIEAQEKEVEVIRRPYRHQRRLLIRKNDPKNGKWGKWERVNVPRNFSLLG